MMRTTWSSLACAVPNPAIMSRRRRVSERKSDGAGRGAHRLPPRPAPSDFRSLTRRRNERFRIEGDSCPLHQRGDGLLDQLVDDLLRGLLARHHADALPGHQRAAIDVAVDDRALQRAGPEALDVELRILLRDLASEEAIYDLALVLNKHARASIGQRAHRNDRKAGIELHRRHRVARRGAV